MNIPESIGKRFARFRARSAGRLALFLPVLLFAVFAPEPYSRYAAALAALVNFLSIETLIKRLRDLTGDRTLIPPGPPDPTKKD